MKFFAVCQVRQQRQERLLSNIECRTNKTLTRRRVGATFPLIATNGARNGLNVTRFLLTGAAATEMTSAVLTRGCAALSKAIAEFDAYLGERGQCVEQVLGPAADSVETYQHQTSRPGHGTQFSPSTG